MCPYLTTSPFFECTASDTAYRLSPFEVDAYCESFTGQRFCPAYCRRRLAEASDLLLSTEGEKRPRPMRSSRKKEGP
jgi:hypothetical protein